MVTWAVLATHFQLFVRHLDISSCEPTPSIELHQRRSEDKPEKAYRNHLCEGAVMVFPTLLTMWLASGLARSQRCQVALGLR